MTAEQAAALMKKEGGGHYSKGHVYNLESDEDGVTLRVMNEAARVYGVTLGEIFRDGHDPVRLPSEFRPLLEPLAPLDHEARISIVRNVAANLRFMQMLYAGAAESFQPEGSNPPPPVTNISTELNPKDIPGAVGDEQETDMPRGDRGPQRQAEGTKRKGRHGKAARQGAGKKDHR